ncbi:DUF4301 family protein [bacterium SCSIO 12741]|nr:DUF4301 family protein [bacterium SCSIO 12741]
MNREEQLKWYRNGIPAIQLDRAAIPGDGIEQLDEQERARLAQVFAAERSALDWIKFTPASGAASRMFKALFEGMQFLQDHPGQSLDAQNDARVFLDKLVEFPFYPELQSLLQEQGLDWPIAKDGAAELAVLELVLDKEGLNYGSLPKALITFHRNENQAVTALEEHFKEGIEYAGSNPSVRLHFTISPEHQQSIQEITQVISNRLGDTHQFQLEFSTQDKSTDLLAVNPDNTPVILASGNELYRPAGHGALLQNLNNLEAELVFIKNIDNVAADPEACQILTYKEALAGLLIEWKTQIHEQLKALKQEGTLETAAEYIRTEFGHEVKSVEEAIQFLNRPIRIGGMVVNTGAPGGGPFWVKNKDGVANLQIVEKSQIDLSNPAQKSILESSTHFNPVDLVCWIRDVDGNPFDLFAFRNDETGFIAEKSHAGEPIRAMELPGLWNGSMDGWLTRFVEVPESTFNPVKTVMNLLDPNHRSSH